MQLAQTSAYRSIFHGVRKKGKDGKTVFVQLRVELHFALGLEGRQVGSEKEAEARRKQGGNLEAVWRRNEPRL